MGHVEAVRRPSVRRIAGRAGRIASPVGLALVLLSFASGFLLVSCDTPGGYGRVKRGGTTTYTGVQLATGRAPTVEAKHLRPAAQRRPDRLPAQPLVALSALGVLAAGVAAVAVRRHRHELTGTLAVGAVFTLTVGVLHTRTLLVDRLVSQRGEPWPRGKTATDYVQVGQAFWFAAIVLGLIAAGHFVAAMRLRGKTGTPAP